MSKNSQSTKDKAAVDNRTLMYIPLIYAQDTPVDMIEGLVQLIADTCLPLVLDSQPAEGKLTQKSRQRLSKHFSNPIFIVDEKHTLSLLIDGISVSPKWIALQRRVVSAGRKSEMILQACKCKEGDLVLDATAGFGQDSLILASTGAYITMLERSPLIAVLLLHEQQLMNQQKNWQTLMSRLEIRFFDAIQFMQQTPSEHFDTIYLDPMFPDNSYDHASTGKGAKVGKQMQALHHIARAPDTMDEVALLEGALGCVKQKGRVVVKRPVSAPNLANRLPNESWQNDVVRFDGYFNV